MGDSDLARHGRGCNQRSALYLVLRQVRKGQLLEEPLVTGTVSD